MQQITNTHAAKVKSPVLSLAISWLIILAPIFCCGLYLSYLVSIYMPVF